MIIVVTRYFLMLTIFAVLLCYSSRSEREEITEVIEQLLKLYQNLTERYTLFFFFL